MVGRAAQHEICTGLTNLSAVQEEADVDGLCMFSPHRQAMLSSFCTDGVAFLAILQALSHLLMMIHKSLHRLLPVLAGRRRIDRGHRRPTRVRNVAGSRVAT
jgi:hypothetical protein